MTANLKHKAISGVLWRGAETFCQRGVAFVVGVVLARIIEPSEFGLLAMLFIFIQLGNTFIISGLGNAIIQRKRHTLLDECSVFYFNVFVAVVVYGVLFLCAPWVSLFYDEPRLTLILRVSALVLIVQSFGQIQTTLLHKELRFKVIFQVTVIASIVSSVLGIAMAYMGFGVWALVASQLSLGVTQTLAMWCLSDWRPKLMFCFQSLRSLFDFGSKFLASAMLEVFFRNIYGLLIGKFFSPASLAFYNRGRNLPYIIASSVNSTVSQVIFPVLSSIQDDAARMKAIVRRAMTTITLVLWPLLIGLAVTAEPFVRVVLTDKWLPAVPYLRIMCIIYAFLPIHDANLQVINAVGRSGVFLKLEIIKKVLIVLVLVVTFQYGVYAMVLGQLGLSINAFFLNSYYSSKFIHYSTWQQFRDLAPVAMVTAIMGGAVYALSLVEFPNVGLQLLTQAFVGAIVYIGICRAIRLTCFMEMREILGDVLKRKLSSE